jgi:hypothetical protein
MRASRGYGIHPGCLTYITIVLFSHRKQDDVIMDVVCTYLVRLRPLSTMALVAACTALVPWKIPSMEIMYL